MASIDSFNDLPDDVLLAMVQDPLFDENDPSQLKLDFEIVKTSESDFEVK